MGSLFRACLLYLLANSRCEARLENSAVSHPRRKAGAFPRGVFSRHLESVENDSNAVPSSEFEEACDYYKNTRRDFDCLCDKKESSIECRSGLECEKDTLLCARFTLSVSFQNDFKMSGTKVCVEYNERVSETENFDYHNGCIKIEAGDGVFNGATCEMSFTIADEPKACSLCDVCEIDGQMAFDIDCNNVDSEASTERCQYVDSERHFFPGFNDALYDDDDDYDDGFHDDGIDNGFGTTRSIFIFLLLVVGTAIAFRTRRYSR